MLGAARAEVDLGASDADRPPTPEQPLLAEHTTLRVGGPARRLVVADTEAELIETVTRARRRRRAGADPRRRVQRADRRRRLRRHGGQDRHPRASTTDVAACSGAVVTGRRGRGLGRPGGRTRSSGSGAGSRRCPASPAWSGRPRSRTSARTGPRSPADPDGPDLRPGDRPRRHLRRRRTAGSATGARGSRPSPDRYLVLVGDLPAPARLAVRPDPLSRAGPDPRRRGGRAGAGGRRPRRRCCGLRRRKGMVLDEDDHDTWSAGSFFTNPILERRRRPTGCPPRRRASRSPTGGSRPAPPG